VGGRSRLGCGTIRNSSGGGKRRPSCLASRKPSSRNFRCRRRLEGACSVIADGLVHAPQHFSAGAARVTLAPALNVTHNVTLSVRSGRANQGGEMQVLMRESNELETPCAARAKAPAIPRSRS